MHAMFHHRKLRGAGDIRADGRTKPDNFYVIELRLITIFFIKIIVQKLISFSMIQQELSFLLTFLVVDV